MSGVAICGKIGPRVPRGTEKTTGICHHCLPVSTARRLASYTRKSGTETERETCRNGLHIFGLVEALKAPVSCDARTVLPWQCVVAHIRIIHRPFHE